MKISPTEIRHDGAVKRHQTPGWAAICTFISLLAIQAFGQTPSLLWSTNVGATLFAVDANTNAYANVGGSVVVINPNGVPVSTNVICPKPGLAQRDASGNYYFAGNFDGTQNFGGITLVGGWTNWPSAGQWTPGYPTHFVAKYNNAGVLQWVKSFGQQASSINQMSDIIVDATGGAIVAHLGNSVVTGPGSQAFTRLDSAGAILWSQAPFGGGLIDNVKLGGLTSSNFCLLRYNFGNSLGAAWRDLSGNNAGTPTEALYPMYMNSSDVRNGRPVLDNFANVLVAGRTNLSSGNQLLRKFNLSGSPLWTKIVNHGEQWSLARDASECFYFGSISNVLIKYDANGNELWSTNCQKEAVKMIVDPSGNRFVGFADGTIARLAPDGIPQPPSILAGPQAQIVSLGSNATFSATIGGSSTLYYRWRKDGTNLLSATATNYSITGVTTNDVGSYVVVVTNLYGSVTSAPAALLISPSFLSSFTGTIGVWGQQATLSVSAWGSGTLTYQWYNTGQLVSGATNSTLVFPSLQITNAGLYSVVVTSQYGAVTNTPAALVVNPANISLGLYAGITINGTIGYTYGIEYTTNLVNANWQSLTNVTLTQPVELWVDTSINVPTAAKRFYRVTAQ